jgi:hypothetical protein
LGAAASAIFSSSSCTRSCSSNSHEQTCYNIPALTGVPGSCCHGSLQQLLMHKVLQDWLLQEQQRAVEKIRMIRCMC